MAILLGLGASGQRVRHDSVAWSPSALSFDHFRGRPSLSSDGSFACFSLYMTGLNDTVGSIVIPGFQTAATMHPYRSWMLPGSCNPGRLAYHDVQFNLVELMRRHLQHDLDRGAADPDFLLDDARQALYQQLFLLDSVSDYGRDTAVVNRWNDTVTAALAAMPAAEHRGTLRHDWLFEMGFGLGMRDYRGALSDGFHDGIDFDYNSSLSFQSHAHIILCDGATMRVSLSGTCISSTGTLAIYGQTEGTGTLIASNTSENEAKASSSISIDESQPTTNIQIRLADGGRLVQKFNHSHRYLALWGLAYSKRVPETPTDT